MLKRSPLVLVFCLTWPTVVEAQWIISTFTGVNVTTPSTISIARPDQQTTLEFVNVHYDAKPFKSPQYYGARLTWLVGGRGLGIEAEFLHTKVYARVDDPVQVRGTSAGAPVEATLPMRTFVHRYNHTHGLNFLFVNLVWRRAVGGESSPVAVAVRAGAGPVRPGRDVVMPDLNVQGYEFAGYGSQAAAGVDVRVVKRLGAMAEYKFSYAKPKISLPPDGHSRMTATTHHFAFGLTIQMTTNK